MSLRLFFDSSAFYAAAYSSTGAAREVILLSLQGRVKIVVSQDVLEETQRNIARKAPELVDIYHLFLSLLTLEIVPDPSINEVREAERHVVQKDAPIVAAARNAKVDYLVTFDKKHLLDHPDLVKYVGAEIVTPREVIAFLKPAS